MPRKAKRHRVIRGPGAPCKSCAVDKKRKGTLNVRLANIGESGESILGIAKEFGLNDDSLRNHYEKHLPNPLRVAVARHAKLKQKIGSFDALASLQRMTERAEQLLDAVDGWLRDPDHPEKYTLDPRTHEVEIVYEERAGKLGESCEKCGCRRREITGIVPQRKRDRLSDLMRRLEEGLGITIVKGETKVADPRALLPTLVTALKPVVELLGKAKGQIRVDEETQRIGRESQLVLVILREELARLGPEHAGRIAARLVEAKAIR